MTSLMQFPLRLEPDESDHEPPADATPVAPEPEPETRPAPLVLLEGDRMGERDHLLAALAHAFRVARRRAKDLAERDGGLPHALVTGRPPSVAEQHEYAKARNWAPPGHDGGVLEGMGVIYHWVIGRPGVAAGNALSALAARPFRWCATSAGALIGANIALYASGHHMAAIITDLGAGLLTAAWAGAGYLLMRATEASDAVRDNEAGES